MKMPATVRVCALNAAIALTLVNTAHAAPASCDRLSAADRVIALQEIQNLVGRYAHLGQLRGEPTLGELFALKTEGVSWRTPTGPQGTTDIWSRLTKPGEKAPPLVLGQLHNHSMLTPVIEIAGDGKTAKGVWDSMQPGANNGESSNWGWTKYAVDFVKEDGVWKIWHMQTYSVFSTPWEKSITESARERREAAAAAANNPNSAGGMGAASAPAAGMGAGEAPAGAAAPTGGPNRNWTGLKNPWRYDGVTPPRGPKIPEPYCTFDPQDSYGNV